MKRVAVCLMLAISPLHAADLPGFEEQVYQLRRIRGRMVMNLTGTLLPSGVWQALTREAEQSAARLLAEPGGWWSAFDDVNLPAISHNGMAWRGAALLARAWAMPASRYHASQEVLDSIHKGLRHLQRFACPDCPKPNNWWAWEIGMPMHVLETLMLCDKSLEPQLRSELIDTLAYVLKVRDEVKAVGPASLPLPDRPGRTDTNQLWRARLCLQLALIIENPAMAGKWAQTALSEIGVPGEGYLQADYSYRFHGANPMWAYGRAFLSDYAGVIEATQGSAFGPSGAQIERFAQMATHYVQGFLYRGSICPAMTGRELTRGDRVYHDSFGLGGLDALSTLVRIGHARAPEFAGIVARDRQYFSASSPQRTRVAQLTAGVSTTRPSPPVNDIFAYPDSDFLQVTRPAWAIGIKMHSVRNKGYESINGENLQGWFLSHGATFHFLSGLEWEGCWPTLDWTRIPGTTAGATVKAQNTSPFVGVLRGSAQRGVAAMALVSGELRARKSWVVDSDAAVCLGSQIAGPGRVETTLFNQPVAAEAAMVIDGEPAPVEAFERALSPRWIWLERMGYVLAPGQRVQVRREQRTSDWSSVRDPRRYGAGEPRSTWYLSASISHDEAHSGYSYILVPDVGLESMPDLAEQVAGRYVIQTGTAHRVTAADSSWEALVFWEAGKAGSIEADAGCLLLRQADAWQCVDPAWRGEPVSLSMDGRKLQFQSEKGRPANPQTRPAS